MRSPFTCLYREIWDDPLVYEMSDIGQLVYLFLISCPQGTGLGCFKAGKAALIEDSRKPPERFNEGFNEGLAQGLFEYDAKTRVVLIPKYFERNPPANPNGIKALAKEFIKIPECELKQKCYHIVGAWVETKLNSFKEPFKELFGKPLSKPFKEQPGIVTPSPSPSVTSSPSNTPSIKEPLFVKVLKDKFGKNLGEMACEQTAIKIIEYKTMLGFSDSMAIEAIKEVSLKHIDSDHKEINSHIINLIKKKHEFNPVPKPGAGKKKPELFSPLYNLESDIAGEWKEIDLHRAKDTINAAIEDGITIPRSVKAWIEKQDFETTSTGKIHI